MMDRIKWLYNRTIDLVFPTRCAFCDEIILPDALCCDECAQKLPPAPSVFLPALDMAFAATEYTMEAAAAVHKLKFKNRPQLAKLFAAIICERLEQELADCRPDVICCVSMHRKKQRRRGYNQAQLMAEEIANILDVPFCNILKKTADTKAQHSLTAAQRKTNLKGAYTVRLPEKVKGRRVLIVDDVITTGATLSECAAALRQSDAAWVGAVAFAHPIQQIQAEDVI